MMKTVQSLTYTRFTIYQRFEYKFGKILVVYNYGTLNKLKRVIHSIKELFGK